MPGGNTMLTTPKDIRAKLVGIAVNNYQKVIRNIQEKRIKKDKTQLQAALMTGSIKRLK